AHRRALRHGAQHPRDADAAAEIGAAGDDRLDGLAGAGGAEVIEHDVVLLEEARILTERRRLVLPVVDLANCHLQLVLGRRRQRQQRKRAGDQPCPYGNPSHRFFLPLIGPRLPACLAACAPRAGRDDEPLRAGAEAPGGIPPRRASRLAQYSQVRSGTLGILLIAPAISISPGVSMPTRPIFLPSLR